MVAAVDDGDVSDSQSRDVFVRQSRDLGEDQQAAVPPAEHPGRPAVRRQAARRRRDPFRVRRGLGWCAGRPTTAARTAGDSPGLSCPAAPCW